MFSSTPPSTLWVCLGGLLLDGHDQNTLLFIVLNSLVKNWSLSDPTNPSPGLNPACCITRLPRLPTACWICSPAAHKLLFSSPCPIDRYQMQTWRSSASSSASCPSSWWFSSCVTGTAASSISSPCWKSFPLIAGSGKKTWWWRSFIRTFLHVQLHSDLSV